MKIHLQDLTIDRDLEINGHEAWLATIYNNFPVPENFDKPRICAKLHFARDDFDNVHVAGTLKYTPFVECSRCSKDIPWALDCSIDVTYKRCEKDNRTRERSLRKVELDTYYLDDESIDVEELVNDTIHEALPNRLVITAKDGKTCGICRESLDGDQVFCSSRDSNKPSPFATLENLEL